MVRIVAGGFNNADTPQLPLWGFGEGVQCHRWRAFYDSSADFSYTVASVEPQTNQSHKKVEITKVEITDDEPEIQYYDIPLSDELQASTIKLCEKYDIDPIIAFAVMQQESTYQPDIISKTNDYGIMQINKVNHKWLSDELGITDFLDPEQNIEAGLYMLGDYLNRYDLHRALMSYNMGESGARKAISRGNSTSKYSRGVEEIMQIIKVREDDKNE